MDTLIESIVQSDTSDGLGCAQLQALLGLVGATPVVLPRTHPLFHRLSNNLSRLAATEETSLLTLRLALLLCADASHREVVFAMVETHGDAIDSAIAPHVAALVSSHSPNTATGTASRRLLSHLFLVVVASGEAKVKAADLVEFVGASVEAAVHLLVLLYADVCGVVPGVAAAVSGALQCDLSLRLVQMLHELTFWTTYESLHTHLGLGSQAQVAASRNNETTPLHVSAGPYRHHVGQIASYILRYDFCRCAVVHLSRLAQEAGVGTGNGIAQLREHFAFLKSLLTSTDQFVAMLRKALFKAGLLDGVCDPLLSRLSRQRPLPAEHRALLLQCVDVTATIVFNCGEGSHYWDSDRAGLVGVVESIAADPAAATAGAERGLTELVEQVVRLVVNTHATTAVPVVLSLWQTHLDEAGKQRVAVFLSNPSSRRRCLDILSPAYDMLRPVFRVDSTHPVSERRTDALQHRGGHRRQQQQQPQRHHQRSRSRGRGGGNGRKGRRGRSRPSRRQKMQRRFGALAQQASPGTEAEKEAAAQHLLETATTDSDSVSSEGEDEEGTEAVAALPVVETLPDVSRWRRGPPPRSVPTRYICAISHSLIRSTPVLSSTGYVFDEDVIVDYLQYYQVCPVSGEPLARSDLLVDTYLKEELSRVRDNFC